MFKQGIALLASVSYATLLLAALPASPVSNAREADELHIVTLSTRPDTVSGGDVFVEVRMPTGATSKDLKVLLNGQTNVTNAFRYDSRQRLVGLVTGLKLGANTLEARVKRGEHSDEARLALVNYPITGPIFSGPHQTPWICQTADFILPDGSNLGPPVDTSCNAPTKVLYLYMPVGGSEYKVLPSTTTLPSDVGSTTTTDGQTVPYIVRLETGTLNRGTYQFAMLFDPRTEKAPDPFGAYKGWNKKLIFTFGGSASAGYIQGTSTGGVLNNFMLSKGFAVISSTLNVFGNNENDVLSAESASMTKEKFIDSFGVSLYTIGWGPSGASMQQHLIANNYPGILDGITPSVSFPDILSVAYSAEDCSLLSRAFQSTSVTWSDAQKAAVSGYSSFSACDGKVAITPNLVQQSWEGSYSPSLVAAPRLVKTALVMGMSIDLSNCLRAVPDRVIYDPISNSTGARCDLYSSEKNLLGIDPGTGFAGMVWDNVGVQYGLKPFEAGTISAEQFIQLNEQVGGYDRDGNLQSARTAAPLSAIAAAYAGGRLNEMQNLGNVPIIDFRAYSETSPGYDVHDSVESMITRARLIKANGSASNQVILRTAPGFEHTIAMQGEILSSMDQWLMNIIKDEAPYPNVAQKVAHNKPAGLVDACYTSSGDRIAEPADISNGGQCGALYPFHANARLVAGAPLTNDVFKCQLRPLRRSDYSTLSDSQYARLNAVFPSGVCDYSLPSVGFAPLKGTWLSYPTPGVIDVPRSSVGG